MRNEDLMIHEEEYGDLQAQSAVSHLSEAIRYRTVSFVDTSRILYGEFDGLQDFLRRAYPLVFAAGRVEVIGHSLLIRIDGTDGTLKPALFIAHQDVVPVHKAGEDWLHDPFSGDVAEGCIWGRGSIDIKNLLIAELEAAEYLLGQGRRPVRSLYFAFGEDEETLNTGAFAIGQKLLAEGTKIEFVLDEGIPAVTDGSVYGAPGVLMCPIGIYEKGYADMYLRAASRGGHSSNPVHGTSLGRLARAITDVLDHPTESCLQQCSEDTLRMLGPQITEEPMKTWAAVPRKFRNEILSYYEGSETLYLQVKTTAAPTQITGGSEAGNVMPGDMEAVINFRLGPQDTTDSLLEHVRTVVGPGIGTGYVQCINASRPSRTDTVCYGMLMEALEHFHRDVLFHPAMTGCTTDAHNYECVSECCWRIAPFLVENEMQAEGMHGINERITVRAYLQGIRVLIRFMDNTCFTFTERNEVHD